MGAHPLGGFGDEFTPAMLQDAINEFGRYVSGGEVSCDWCGETFHEEDVTAVEPTGALREDAVLCTANCLDLLRKEQP